jgi:DNA-binding SARP family transcriptional activator
MLRVRRLGAVAAERDGEPVPVPGSARRLLAFLALRPGPHDRDALAAQFWPDVPQPAARASLRTAVWALRRALGEDALVASRSTVGLCPEALRVDVAEVATLAGTGEDMLALEQCRGELLADLDEDWARAARAEHQARHAGLLDRLAERAETGGDAAAAVRWSQLRCALTLLDEPAHCDLLRRLAAAGDRAGALATGRAFAQRLRTELGVTPGPATRAVLAQLRGPTTAAGASPDGAARPLFGRSRELAALTAAWSAARDGHGRVVVVTGEGGIGKTRLVTELARRADNAGGRVAVGAGVDVRWRGAVRGVAGAGPSAGAHRAGPAGGRRLAAGAGPAGPRPGYRARSKRGPAAGRRTRAGAVADLRRGASAGGVGRGRPPGIAGSRGRAPRRPGQPAADDTHWAAAGRAAGDARADPPRPAGACRGRRAGCGPGRPGRRSQRVAAGPTGRRRAGCGRVQRRPAGRG